MNLKYNLMRDFPEEGVLFIDFMPTFTNKRLMNEVAKHIATKVMLAGDVDYIVMPESRGYILGTLIANKLKVSVLPIRKHGKLPAEFIGATEEYQTEYSTAQLDIPKINLERKKCYFIDDVYATGGTYEACKKLVEKMGGNMLGGFCLYSVGLDNNKEIKYILSRKDIEEEIMDKPTQL